MTNKLLDSDCRLRIELLFNYHGGQYKAKRKAMKMRRKTNTPLIPKLPSGLIHIFSYLVTTSRFISDFQRFDTTD